MKYGDCAREGTSDVGVVTADVLWPGTLDFASLSGSGRLLGVPGFFWGGLRCKLNGGLAGLWGLLIFGIFK